MRRIALTALALAACVTAMPAQMPDGPGLDSIFARYTTPGSPGCVLGVSRDGQIVLERAWGLADVERGIPLTPTAILEAGSVSKQFTAATVLLLARDGRLTLDDDVRRWMPELPDYGVTVTIRQLIHHTSGMRDWGSVSGIAGWPRNTRALRHAHVLEIIARIRELNFAPGSEYDYSNTNYNLLAMIAERAARQDFPTLTRERLFTPLGMSATSWRDDATRLVPHRAPSYSRAPGGWRLERAIESIVGNCCLLTTVGDLLRWNAAFDSTRLGGPGFTAERERRGVLTNGRTIAYAAGLFVDEDRGEPVVEHDGATAGYRAALVRYPRQRVSIAVLCNAGDANPTAHARAVATRLLGLRAPAAAPPPRATVPPAAIADKAGLYRNQRTMTAQRFVVRDGTLRTENGVELIPESPTAFVAASGAPRLLFDRRADGRYDVRIVTPAGDTVAAVAVGDADTTRAALAAYGGSWRSDEAGVTLRITQETDGSLLLRRPPDSTALRPIYRDGFQSPLGVMVFERDARGRVSGMRLTAPRVRHLRFVREGEGGR